MQLFSHSMQIKSYIVWTFIRLNKQSDLNMDCLLRPVHPNTKNCTARQCSPLRRKFMECYITNPALSILIKHLVIGQRQNAPNFSAFHWSPHGSLVSIGQHFVTTGVVHLPKRTETSLITESDQRASNHQLCSYARPA